MTKECSRGALDPDKCRAALGLPSPLPPPAPGRSVSNHFERLFGSAGPAPRTAEGGGMRVSD